jgi:xanthine dehydrogenase molybdopterin-binding subunit B
LWLPFALPVSQPHATIVKIDDEAARASPGVLAIYYAKDVPGTIC